MTTHACDFPECKKVFLKPWRLKEHQCSAHTGERPYVCKQPGCGKAFIRAYHLKRHSVSHLDSKPEFRCSVAGCGRVYSLLQNLRKHERTHTNPQPYKCDVEGCDKVFKKHSLLSIHKARHDGDAKPFRCSQEGCSAAFVWPSELRKHQKAHKEYSCPVKNCDVVRYRWTDMREHISSHGKIHGCPECGKTFQKRSQLKAHSRIHCETRSVLPCEWEECGRSYTTAYNLEQHVRSFHLQEKPHKCTQPACSSRFSTKQALKRHLKMRHSSGANSTKKRKSTKRSLSSRLSGYKAPTKRIPTAVESDEPHSQGNDKSEMPDIAQRAVVTDIGDPGNHITGSEQCLSNSQELIEGTESNGSKTIPLNEPCNSAVNHVLRKIPIGSKVLQ